MAVLSNRIKEIKEEQLPNLMKFRKTFIIFWILRFAGLVTYIPLFYLYRKLWDVKASSPLVPFLRPIVIILHKFGVGGIVLVICLLFFICSLIYLIKIANILYSNKYKYIIVFAYVVSFFIRFGGIISIAILMNILFDIRGSR